VLGKFARNLPWFWNHCSSVQRSVSPRRLKLNFPLLLTSRKTLKHTSSARSQVIRSHACRGHVTVDHWASWQLKRHTRTVSYQSHSSEGRFLTALELVTLNVRHKAHAKRPSPVRQKVLCIDINLLEGKIHPCPALLITGKASVRIRKAGPREGGKYMCTARNLSGEAQSVCEVRVIRKVDEQKAAANEAPSFATKLSDLILEDGQDLKYGYFQMLLRFHISMRSVVWEFALRQMSKSLCNFSLLHAVRIKISLWFALCRKAASVSLASWRIKPACFTHARVCCLYLRWLTTFLNDITMTEYWIGDIIVTTSVYTPQITMHR